MRRATRDYTLPPLTEKDHHADIAFQNCDGVVAMELRATMKTRAAPEVCSVFSSAERSGIRPVAA
jgi:hypothetical protein